MKDFFKKEKKQELLVVSYVGQGENRIRFYKIKSSDRTDVSELFHKNLYSFTYAAGGGKGIVLIDTSEGLKMSRIGDFLVEDSRGKLMIRKPDEFQLEYGHLLEGAK